MSYTRYRSTYYNTTGDSVQWTIEICDTEMTSQVIRFESHEPTFSYEGLTQDLKSGIYPSSFKFGMYIRESPKNIGGYVYGPSHSFVQDLFESNEGRFRVKLYKDGQIYFIGVILPDECSFEDFEDPYLMQITAVDGLYRLRSEDYVSVSGNINYVTLEAHGIFNEEFDSTPLSAGLVGTEWVLIEHLSLLQDAGGGLEVSSRKTTYARYEQYAVESPGTGWVSQGSNLWAKEVAYDNEVIINESDRYHLTRDIDDDKFRTISEYFQRAMEIIPCWDEYAIGSIMYDVCDVWYDTSTYDLTVDPNQQTKLNETKIATGNKWWDVIETILKHKFLRLYYSNARFHIEQISERGNTTITRHCYDPEGTLVIAQDVNLDLSYAGEGLSVASGGKYRVLAALRSVKVKMSFDSDNLLAGQHWNLTREGTRYLARIRTSQLDTRLLIRINVNCIATFSLPTLSLPESFTSLKVNTHIQIRVVNIETGISYYLTPPSQDNHADPTWETDEVAGYFSKDVNLTGENPLYQRRAQYFLDVLTDELPGNAGESFDVYTSVNFSYAFHLQNAHQHFLENPDQLDLYVGTKDPSMTTVDQDKEPVDSFKEKAYEAVNSRDNTVVVEMDAKFSDDGILGNAILIKTSATPENWTRSSGNWSRFGLAEGNGKLLQLLAQEMLSIRTVPLRVYQGGFVSTLITTQNRINRNSIIYLPLSLQVNTHMDLASGEFVHLEREPVDDAEIIEQPFDAGEPIVVSGPGDPNPPVDPPLVLETNEVITGGGGAVTELDIVNTMGATIAAGEVVRITHPTTGDYETVTLTEDILPASTIMYFVSHAFILSFPDASPITIQVIAHPPGYPGLPFNYEKRQYSASQSVAFPDYYSFPDPEENSAVIINSKIRIERDGVRMIYVPGAASATPIQNRVHLWDIDYANRVATFPIAFSEERLTITAK